MLRILLASKDAFTLQYLKKLIPWKKYDLKILAETDHAGDAWNLYQKHMPDVVLTDIYLCGKSGLDFVSRIRVNDHETAVLFLSDQDDFPTIHKAMELEAFDYLLKSDLCPATLLNCFSRIQKKIDRDSFQRRIVSEKLFSELIRDFQTNNQEQYQEFFPGTYDLLFLSQDHIQPVIENPSGFSTTAVEETEIKRLCYNEKETICIK